MGLQRLQKVKVGYKRLQGWGYRGSQWVTSGYRRLQKVTGAYKGLQGVTGGYKIKGDRGLQVVTVG